MSTGFWVVFPHTHVLPHSCARLPQLPPLESFPAHTDHWSPPRLVFLASAYKGENMAFVFLFCPHFTEQNVLLFHRLWHKGQDFIFFLYGWLIVLYTNIEYFLHSSVVGMSHVWASVSGTITNMGMRGPPFQAECVCVGYYPGVG